MSTKDVIKSSIYESFSGETNLSADTIIGILIFSCLVGLYLFFVYKCMAKVAFYCKDLNITIAGMPVIVAAIMIAMQSNLLVSLGMVGALSIVRFRTAVKNPLDLLFLFWSISAGIICGVNLKVLVLLLSVIMTVLILLLQLIPVIQAPSVLVLRSNSTDVDWEKVNQCIRKNAGNVKQKSRSYQSGQIEIIYELRIKNENDLLTELQNFTQINGINVLSHDGEYRI